MRLLFTLISFALITHAHASVSVQEAVERQLILNNIEITGLGRTSENVVRQELLLAEGRKFTEQQFSESIQRLKNLRIFSQVKPELNLVDDQHVKLTSHMEEKWTTVPVMRGSSGGNARYFVIGAYDINTFGKYKEVGGQYENYNGEHSYVVWYRNPRFFKQRLLFGTDLWSVTRPYTHYNSLAEVEKNFLLVRKKWNSFIELELRPWLNVGSGLEFDRDELRTSDGDAIFYRSNANILRFNLSLGRLNYENYLINGIHSRIEIEQALDFTNNDESFTRANWTSRAFLKLPYKSNLAFHLRTGMTSSYADQHIFYLGGLENIRGYFDNQFHGRYFWQSNNEFRIPSIQSRWFVLQHSLFFDIAQVSNLAGDLMSSTLVGSYGTGLRFISPKIYRLTLRLDIARPLSNTGAGNISFGAQQFF